MQHTCTSAPYSRQRTASYMQNISCRLKRLAANFSVFNALRLATRVLGSMGAYPLDKRIDRRRYAPRLAQGDETSEAILLLSLRPRL
jgi:hypothetical protein